MEKQLRLRWFAGLLLSSMAALLCVHSAFAQQEARKILKRVEAQYPNVLKRRGIGGTVRLQVSIKADGTVKDAQVLGGNAILSESAQAAVKQWKFAPAVAETTMEITIVFDPQAQ